MKIYETKSHHVSDNTSSHDSSHFETTHYREFTSSASDASKARTRLKKLKHEDIVTTEVEVDPTRSGILAFLNERMAEPSWIMAPVTEKLGG